jgi:hypothetical protein
MNAEVRGMKRFALLGLAAISPVVAAAEPSALEQFAGAIMASVTDEGPMDLSAFDCRPMQGPGQQMCRDKASGVGFSHMDTEGSDVLGISVEMPGRNAGEAEVAASAGILVRDAAEFDALRSAFGELEQSPLFDGLKRCAFLPKADGPDAIRGFAVAHPATGTPVGFVLPSVNPAAEAALTTPPGDTVVLLSIIVVNQIYLDCQAP